MMTTRTNGDTTRRPAHAPAPVTRQSAPGHGAPESRKGAAGKRSERIVAIVSLIVCGILAAAILVYGMTISGAASGSGGAGKASIATMTKGMEVLSSYTATSTSTDENRLTNISLAVESVTANRVEKGGLFSFNNAVGDTSNDTRYKEANAIDGSTVVSVRGGGICQVSSALYIAALEAGLEIVERYPHTVAQDYVPLGLDATVSYGDLDFVFKNTSGNPIVIEAVSSGSKVTVTIYGTPSSSGETYETTSQYVDTYTAMGTTGMETVYVANAYLLCYRNGVCVERSLISTDTYITVEGETLPDEKSAGDSGSSGY